MHGPLHLVVELNTWAPLGADPAARSNLESHLMGRPEITLTLVTRGSLRSALDRLGPARVLPAQIIAEAGTAIHHAAQGWQADAQYRTWVEAHWEARLLEALIRLEFEKSHAGEEAWS